MATATTKPTSKPDVVLTLSWGEAERLSNLLSVVSTFGRKVRLFGEGEASIDFDGIDESVFAALDAVLTPMAED